MEYDKKIFAENLLREMNKRDLKSSDIAQMLNVSKATVSNWTRGEKVPRMDKVEELAALFNIKKSELIEDKNAEKDELQDYLEELRSRPEMRMLFSISKDATKEDVEKAVAIIEALRKQEGR